MSAENLGLVEFAKGTVWPMVEDEAENNRKILRGSDGFWSIGFVEKNEELSDGPDQVHMVLSWDKITDPKQVVLRIGERREKGAKVITIMANPTQLGSSSVEVNGDPSWTEQFKKELRVFLSHPEFCTIATREDFDDDY